MSNRRPPAGSAPLGGGNRVSSTPARTRPAARYRDPVARRMALAPGLLGAVVMLAGLALLDVPAFVGIRYAAAILAAIVGWFSIQGRAWWALPLLAAIVVIWNPVFPLDIHGRWWVAGQFGATIVFVVCAILIRVRIAPDDSRRASSGSSPHR